MKHICILSMQRINNFGSLLQSYSLKKILSDLGFEVAFIDIKSIQEDKIQNIKSTMEDNDVKRKNLLVNKIQKIDQYAINRIKIRHIADIQNQYFEDFRVQVLGINKNRHERYDYCIIGSDEVFNCMQPSPWGFTSRLFGNVQEADRVITYAASCGNTMYNQLSEVMRKRVEKAFKNIEGVSVRDKATKDFVSKFTNTFIYEHLDPVLIGDFEDEMISNGSNLRIKEAYCVVYSYYNRINSYNEINSIKKFCKRNNLKIVAVGAPQFWINNYYPLNPFEMLNVFKNAEFVITDTFHGSIFAYKYSRKFAVMPRKSNYNKIMDLLDRLRIKHHITDFSDLQNKYMLTKNQQMCNETMCIAKEESKKYFKQFLLING